MEKKIKMVYLVSVFQKDTESTEWKDTCTPKHLIGIWDSLDKAECFVTGQLSLVPCKIEIHPGNDKYLRGLFIFYYLMRKTNPSAKRNHLYKRDEHPTYIIEAQEVLK